MCALEIIGLYRVYQWKTGATSGMLRSRKLCSLGSHYMKAVDPNDTVTVVQTSVLLWTTGGIRILLSVDDWLMCDPHTQGEDHPEHTDPPHSHYSTWPHCDLKNTHTHTHHGFVVLTIHWVRMLATPSPQCVADIIVQSKSGRSRFVVPAPVKDARLNCNHSFNSNPSGPCGIEEISEVGYYCQISINFHILFWVCLGFLCCILTSASQILTKKVFYLLPLVVLRFALIVET